jgi:hypothetical protein
LIYFQIFIPVAFAPFGCSCYDLLCIIRKAQDMTNTSNTSNSITRITLSSDNFLTGTRRTLMHFLWAFAMVAFAITSIYVGWAFFDYLNSGVAGVEGRWQADNTIRIVVTDENTRASIQDGDTLLLRDGEPLPPRSAYLRSEQVIIYGAFATSTTLTVQTADAPPREVTVSLSVEVDPIMNLLVEMGISRNTAMIVRTGIEVLWLALFWGMAVFILLQRPDDGMVIAVSVATIALGMRFSGIDYLRWLPPYETNMHILLGSIVFYYSTVILRLPNGRLMPRVVSLLILIAIGLLYTNRQTNTVPFFTRGNFLIFDTPLSALMFLVQFYRYRHYYTSVQRQQSKWLLLGIGFAFFLYYSRLVIEGIIIAPSPLLILFFTIATRISIIAVPICLLIAMLRYRLYDADYILNRGLVYGVASMCLLAFFAVVTLLIRQVMGENRLSDVALLGVGIGLGVAFNPLRQRIQHVIDRRFFRLRLDLNQLAKLDQTRRLAGVAGDLDGITFDDYRIESLFARGGMGEVYKARRGSQQVAFKVLSTNSKSTPEVVARFQREMTILSQINHPNIVHFLGGGHREGTHYLAMEFLQGSDLNDYLKTKEILRLDEALLILRDIASALDYLHGLGYVHRDVKPANIVIQDTRAVLTDFGLIRPVNNNDPITMGAVVGTLDYTAPEQIADGEHIDHRADIYALGIVTYQMLTGEKPFKGNVGQLVFSQLNEPAPNIGVLRPDLSPDFRRALLKAMEKDPKARYNSAGEFVTALGGDK